MSTPSNPLFCFRGSALTRWLSASAIAFVSQALQAQPAAVPQPGAPANAPIVVVRQSGDSVVFPGSVVVQPGNIVVAQPGVAVEGAPTNAVMSPDAIMGAMGAADAADEPGQDNQGGVSEDNSDTNSSSAGGVQRPNRFGSRSEYDGRQSRKNRFTRPDAQRNNPLGNAPSTTGGTNGPGKYDYASFQVIVERNIFDPNRRPRVQGPQIERPPQVMSDYFSLVGVMSYEAGQFAFFSGNQSRYERSGQVSDVIAGCKIADINVRSNAVVLETGTNRFELQVGMGLRRENSGPWELARSRAIFAAIEANPSAGSDSPSARTGSGGKPASADEDNDVIKRLMQRREQQ